MPNSVEETLSAGEEFLEHHGVKGMKWGVRRKDAKFEKRASHHSTFFKVYDGAAERMNSVEIPRINNMPQYKGVDFTKDSPKRRAYYKEYEKTFSKALDDSAARFQNASGTRRYTATLTPDGGMAISTKEIKHAADLEMTFKVRWGSNGEVLAIVMPDDVEHADRLSQDFLKHYGIKGMRWGVRREDPSDSLGPTENRVDSKNGKITKVTVSKSTRDNPNPSEDASRAAVLKKRASTKSTDSLSNRELQDLVTRMNLEQQYSRLANPQNSNSLDPGKMVKDILMQEGKKQLSKFVQDQMTKRVAAAMGGKTSSSGASFKRRKSNGPERLAIGG